jgi:hypothetical protein
VAERPVSREADGSHAGASGVRRRDVFISHASEDKVAIARPLADALRARGCSVWFDDYELVLGDSLRAKIDDGLRQARVGVVILSRSFFAKRWPQRELDGLTMRQLAGEDNVILPVLHEIGHDDVRSHSLPLADLVAAKSSDGVDAVADAVVRALRMLDEVEGAPAETPYAPRSRPQKAARSRPLRLIIAHPRRSLLLAVLLVAVAIGVNVTVDMSPSSDPQQPPPPAPPSTIAQRVGPNVDMTALGGAGVLGQAHLVSYGSNVPALDVVLSRGGRRYQLLLFDRLAGVRRFDTLPSDALLVLGGKENGDLVLNPGSGTQVFSNEPGLPKEFRSYRYFGIARAAGSTRTMVLYGTIDSLGEPT